MAWLAVVLVLSMVWGVSAWRSRNSPARVVARALEGVWERLKAAHGAKDFYSGDEVTAALTAAGVTGDIAPFAYARYCREADFRAATACAGHSYRGLRDEMLQASRSGQRFPHRKPNV